jgi:hypothetical protein
VSKTAGNGVPWLKLEKQVVGLKTDHGLGGVGVRGVVVIFRYILCSL